MARYSNERPNTTQAMLSNYTVDELKQLGGHLLSTMKRLKLTAVNHDLPSGGSRLPTRKAELVTWVLTPLQDCACLQSLYQHLSALEQAVIQEAVHTPDGTFDSFQFKAKYGSVPQTHLSNYWSSRKNKDAGVSTLALFFAQGTMLPPDLQKQFKQFVPQPKGVAVQVLDELPEALPLHMYGRENDTVPLKQHATEQAALQDLMAVLQLADMGKIGVSTKTSRVTNAGATAIRRILSHGDFYPDTLEAPDSYEIQIGDAGIRPFAWPLLLQAAKLAQINGNKLALTRTGQTALKKPPHETIAKLWQRWLNNKLLHELSRVELIKGQKSKSRPLAAADTCRKQLAAALAELEEGVWIETETFFKFLIAQGHNMTVARNPWELYLFDKQYGSLGYDTIGWGIAESRFSRAFLLEYAATLGLLDVALVPPWGALRDFGDLWGADDLSCISRYDGLHAIRLTALGAWVLGQRDTYVPDMHQEPSLTIADDMTISFLPSVGTSSSDELFLNRCFDQTFHHVWRIALPKLLEAVEEGVDIDQVINFLQERSEGAFPPSVQDFFDTVLSRLTKVRDRGEARLIECADVQTAHLILSEKHLQGICFLAEDRYIVVPREHDTLFRKTLRNAGYVLPGVTTQQ